MAATLDDVTKKKGPTASAEQQVAVELGLAGQRTRAGADEAGGSAEPANEDGAGSPLCMRRRSSTLGYWKARPGRRRERQHPQRHPRQDCPGGGVGSGGPVRSRSPQPTPVPDCDVAQGRKSVESLHGVKTRSPTPGDTLPLRPPTRPRPVADSAPRLPLAGPSSELSATRFAGARRTKRSGDSP